MPSSRVFSFRSTWMTPRRSLAALYDSIACERLASSAWTSVSTSLAWRCLYTTEAGSASAAGAATRNTEKRATERPTHCFTRAAKPVCVAELGDAARGNSVTSGAP